MSTDDLSTYFPDFQPCPLATDEQRDEFVRRFAGPKAEHSAALEVLDLVGLAAGTRVPRPCKAVLLETNYGQRLQPGLPRVLCKPVQDGGATM